MHYGRRQRLHRDGAPRSKPEAVSQRNVYQPSAHMTLPLISCGVKGGRLCVYSAKRMQEICHDITVGRVDRYWETRLSSYAAFSSDEEDNDLLDNSGHVG